jgi:cysteinyl-tRNA synthetase
VGFEKLQNTLRNLREEITRASGENRTVDSAIDLTVYDLRFRTAMDDDFNTPQAIAVLFDLSRETNALLSLETKFSVRSLRAIDDMFREFGGTVLGLLTEGSVATVSDAKLDADLMQLIIDVRTDVRTQKLWPLSDKIRDGLKKLGIALEDKKDGTGWRRE